MDDRQPCVAQRVVGGVYVFPRLGRTFLILKRSVPYKGSSRFSTTVWQVYDITEPARIGVVINTIRQPRRFKTLQETLLILWTFRRLIIRYPGFDCTFLR